MGTLLFISDDSSRIGLLLGTGDFAMLGLNTETQVQVVERDATLAELEPGMLVEIAYGPDSFLASRIRTPAPFQVGETQFQEGMPTTVKMAQGTLMVFYDEYNRLGLLLGSGDFVILSLNSDTQLQLVGRSVALAELQAGMWVEATYNPATLVASLVRSPASFS